MRYIAQKSEWRIGTEMVTAPWCETLKLKFSMPRAAAGALAGGVCCGVVVVVAVVVVVVVVVVRHALVQVMLS